MDEAAIRKQVYELNQLIVSSPLVTPGAKPGEEGSYRSHPGPGKLDALDALGLLRLQVKYLLFDLEATRRENRYLRQMLEARHKRNREDDGDSGTNGWEIPPTA